MLAFSAASSEAKKAAAVALAGIQRAEDELAEISQLLASAATGGRAASAASVAAPEIRGVAGERVVAGSRRQLARQAAAELAQAEELLAQLTSDLRSGARNG